MPRKTHQQISIRRLWPFFAVALIILAVSLFAVYELINVRQTSQLLFVLSAESGKITDEPDSDTHTLSFQLDTKLVHYFSDRPERLAGSVTPERFTELSFADKTDPPNAAFITYDINGKESYYAFELLEARVNGRTITFKIRELKDTGEGLLAYYDGNYESELPVTFASAALFVDAIPTPINGQITD